MQFVERWLVRLGLGLWTVVSYGFYGNLYEDKLCFSSKTFFWCGLGSFGLQTSSEEINVLLLFLFTDFLVSPPPPIGSLSLLY